VIYYANPSTEPIRDAMAAGQLGCIVTPRQGNVTFPGEWDVIADNGCFGGKWNHREWFDWVLDLPRTVRFVVAPDVFDPAGGECHTATLARWETYGPTLERHGFTPAFVCQVGATPDNVPPAPVFFLGGTTEWKLGEHARAVTEHALQAGAWVHMGRVNSRRRIEVAIRMGCDSVDGTFLTYGPDVNLPRLLRYLSEATAAVSQAPSFFDGHTISPPPLPWGIGEHPGGTPAAPSGVSPHQQASQARWS
jgi:hypothetical protein